MAMNPRLLRPTASGFRPSQISGLSAWYDASVASSVTLTGGFVSQWSDLSGGGLHLTQSVEADRPGTGTLNGRTAVSFDGSNDYLANAAVPSGWTFGSVFVAFSQDTTAASQLLVNMQVAAANGRMSLLWSNAGEFRAQSVNSAATQTGRSGGSAATATPRVFAYTFDGATTAGLRLNAATLSGTTTTTGGNDAGLVIGARRSSAATSLPFDGLIGEVVIYNRVLSAAEITRVERYLAAKWGVTLYSPPTYADAGVNAYISAVELADGGLMLETGVRDAINDFITGCKADGIWTAIKASCILAGARTLAGALVPLVGTAPTNTNFVSGDYNRKTGLAGGTNKRLVTSYLTDPSQLNNRHDAVYVHTAGADGGMYWTTQVTGGINQVVIKTATNNLGFRLWSGSDTDIDNSTATGFIGQSKQAAGNATVRILGSNVTGPGATAGTPAGGAPLSWFAREAGGFASTGRHQFVSAGDGLDLALLDTRVSALVTAIGAAIP